MLTFISLICTLIVNMLFVLDVIVAILLFVILLLLLILLIFLDRLMLFASRYITYLESKEEAYKKAMKLVSRSEKIVVSMVKGPTFRASSDRKDFFKFIEEEIQKNQKVKFIRIFYEDFSKTFEVSRTNPVLEHIINVVDSPNVEVYLLNSVKHVPAIMIDYKHFVTPLFEIDDKSSAGLYFADEELGKEFYKHIDNYIRGNPNIRGLTTENIKDYYKI